MFRIVSRLVAPLAVACFCAATSAQAGIIANATFGFAPFGDDAQVTYLGASLSVAASVNLPSDAIVVNSVPATYLGNPNDFKGPGPNSITSGNPVAIPSVLSVSSINGGTQASVIPNFLVWGPSNRYSFDMSTISWTSSNTGDLHFFALGTFKDALGTFFNNSADISGSFTQAGQGTVNTSFTFETPPQTHAPEPGSMAILLGMFAGIGLFGWRRQS